MDKHFFEEVINKHVKIKTKDNFVIDGHIVELFNDCFRFKSKFGTSLIIYDDVAMLMEVQ
jgi:hypothetical protein